MSDRIELRAMTFLGRHGVLPEEQRDAQPFEIDVELHLDLQPAGVADDLARTVDYGRVFEEVRRIVESTSYRLIEALAEAIAHELLIEHPADRVVVRIRKPKAPLPGRFEWAGVEIVRERRPA